MLGAPAPSLVVGLQEVRPPVDGAIDFEPPDPPLIEETWPGRCEFFIANNSLTHGTLCFAPQSAHAHMSRVHALELV